LHAGNIRAWRTSAVARFCTKATTPECPGTALGNNGSTWRSATRSCATCPVQWFQLYFDDARSLGAKWTEFRRQGLLGTGVWTSAFEGDSGDLSAALRKVWLVGN